MVPPVVEQMRAWLKAHEHRLLEDSRALLRIPSVQSDPLPGAPFGQANRDALDFMLGLAAQAGMRAIDMDGYIGYGEFGEGTEMVMTLGHLDVVPVGPGWRHEPFGAEVDDGYVYARGAVDDKGPTMAAFYAARALQECFPDLARRVRCVFGCNEESGFECVAHYMKSEEPPLFGVAPDSGWPLFHGEKGIANLVVERPLVSGPLSIRHVGGGQRPNIVIDQAEGRVHVHPTIRAAVKAALADAWDKNVTWHWDGDDLTLTAIGKASHGAHPVGGDNAASRLFRFLVGLAPVEQRTEYEALFETGHIGGNGVGIAGADGPSGPLTANLGIVETVDGRIRLTINVRYPVTWRFDDLRARAEAFLAGLPGGYVLARCDDSPPLYFPLEHPLVTTVCEVYRLETGEDKSPGTMGGGTYARAVPNTVSIGTGWVGDGDAHEADERLRIEHLYRMSRIYAHILYRLAVLPAPG